MTINDPTPNSWLYYLTLSVVLSLLAAAALSQGGDRSHAEPPQALESVQTF